MRKAHPYPHDYNSSEPMCRTAGPCLQGHWEGSGWKVHGKRCRPPAVLTPLCSFQHWRESRPCGRSASEEGSEPRREWRTRDARAAGGGRTPRGSPTTGRTAGGRRAARPEPGRAGRQYPLGGAVQAARHRSPPPAGHGLLLPGRRAAEGRRRERLPD